MTPARRLLGYMARYRRSFLIGFACVIITSSIALTGPWVTAYAALVVVRFIIGGLKMIGFFKELS